MTTIAPELQVLFIHIVTLGVAYLGIYPSLPNLTASRLMSADVAVSAIVFVLCGALYFGKGIGFSLLIIDVPWWVFTFVTGALMEMPLLYWFIRKHDLDMFDDE